MSKVRHIRPPDLAKCGDDQPVSREILRSRRKRDVSSKTINMVRLPKWERRHLQIVSPETTHDRPMSRADCEGGYRPCPYVGCAFNLYLDVNKNGNIKLNFPDLEPGEMAHSCILDVTRKGAVSTERVAELLNMTRERVRQIERKLKDKLRTSFEDPR